MMEKVDAVESATEPCSIVASRGSRRKKRFLTRDAQEAKDGLGNGGGGGGGGGACVFGTGEAKLLVVAVAGTGNRRITI
jgi:hypothetical protein